jgi:protein-S-isoprenylcysteine O-methyltransferase Ste14
VLIRREKPKVIVPGGGENVQPEEDTGRDRAACQEPVSVQAIDTNHPANGAAAAHTLSQGSMPLFMRMDITGGLDAMIPNTLLTLLLCNFIAIGLLPLLFFRRDGEYNLNLLATGAPFFIVPTVLLLGRMEVLHPLFISDTNLIAVPLSAISVALIAMTVGSHRIPLALWHQDNDAPEELVTWGAYARIRHPFYTSFIFAFAASAVAFPHAMTIGCLIYALVSLTVAAVREERRLSMSEFGADYVRYVANSGRFFPRLLP